MDAMHKTFGLCKLKIRRKLFILNTMYKYSKKIENVEVYRPNIMLRTGPKVKLKLPFTAKDRVIKSSYYLVVCLWNKLDADLQTADSFMVIKQKLKKFDIDNMNFV